MNPPVEDIEIFENGDSDGLLKVANSRVFFSYSEWEAFCGSLDEREKDFCDGKVSEEIFDDKQYLLQVNWHRMGLFSLI